MKRVLILLFCLNFVSSAVRNTYEGWKLFRIWPKDHEIVDTIALLYENSMNIDFWTAIREPGQPVDIAVAEIAHPSFQNILNMIEIKHRVELEHVDWALNKERKQMKAVEPVEKGDINFKTYHRYDTIMAYLAKLAETYEEVDLEKIGTTSEGRDITVVKISTDSSVKRPAILIDAALSPREWIGPAQALYIIQDLVINPENRALIENVDWYIIPLVNPDGYEYSHTIQRLWKKNRSKNSEGFGTYINRNFDINWAKNITSANGEDWNYHGTEPFSEAESKALKEFIEENSESIKLYLSLHSFGPAILYPFGYTTDKPGNIKLYRWLGRKVAAAIADSSDHMYKVRPSSGKNLIFSGSSVDWAVKSVGIPLAYTLELPSAGYTGYDFPISRIEEVVAELIPGIHVFHDYVKTQHYSPEKIDEKEIEAEDEQPEEVIIEEAEEEASGVEGNGSGDSEDINAEDDEDTKEIKDLKYDSVLDKDEDVEVEDDEAEETQVEDEDDDGVQGEEIKAGIDEEKHEEEEEGQDTEKTGDEDDDWAEFKDEL